MVISPVCDLKRKDHVIDVVAIIYGQRNIFFDNGIDTKFLVGFIGRRNELVGDLLRRTEVLKVYKARPDLASLCWHSAVTGMTDI